MTEDDSMSSYSPPPPPPSSPGYGPPPPQYGPEPPRRGFRQRRPKTFWALVIVGILLVIGVVSSLANPPKDTSAATDQGTKAPATTAAGKAPAKKTTAAAAPAPAQGPGVGDEVRDGQFAFTVTNVKCGVKEVGDQYLNAKAQGQFCLVSLTVKNIGDSPQTMLSDNQNGFIGDTKYGVDDTATLYASKGGESPWIKDINPGNTLTGKIVFDIPKGKSLTKLELHDSAFSGGAEVALR